MGERKVLVRYVPPDFDPSIIPKFKRDKNRKVEVRMMLPFSMRCTTCSEYMGRGKKVNSRKEDCVGEDYMGIRRFRFVFKCPVCSAQVSFKTDPKNSDYECEYGATRNYEVWKDNEAAIEQDEREKAEEEKLDAMRALENRTLDSKTEMDILDALDETLAINRRHERVDTDALLVSIAEKDSKALEETEDAQIEAFRNRKRNLQTNSTADAAGPESLIDIIARQSRDQPSSSSDTNQLQLKIVPKKRKVSVESAPASAEEVLSSVAAPNSVSIEQTVVAPAAAPSILFGDYGSSGDEN
jgi:hypothetical protein